VTHLSQCNNKELLNNLDPQGLLSDVSIEFLRFFRLSGVNIYTMSLFLTIARVVLDGVQANFILELSMSLVVGRTPAVSSSVFREVLRQ